MDDVKHFDARVGNSVNNQVRIKNDVSVHAAFCWYVATYWVQGVVVVKIFDTLRNLIEIFTSLYVTKCFNTVFKY